MFLCYSFNHTGTSLVAIELKKRNPKLILISGGPDITHPELVQISSGYKIHKNHMDFLVYGEGELRIIKLIKSILNKTPIDDVYIMNCKKEHVKSGLKRFSVNP